MKILVTDSLAPQGLEVFQRAQGFEVDVRIGLKPEELKKIVADYDGWVIRSGTKITAELIEAGDSIIIGGGSTTFGLVEFLPPTDLDILTNSFPIAAKLMETSRNRITLPGGTYYREQQIILSPFDGDASENFSASKLFTGCLGINRLGVMETDPLIARAQTRLLKRADKVIVMADASKLRKRSSMIVCGLERIAVLVTDNGAAAADLEVYRSAGIEVIVASVLAEDGLTKSA